MSQFRLEVSQGLSPYLNWLERGDALGAASHRVIPGLAPHMGDVRENSTFWVLAIALLGGLLITGCPPFEYLGVFWPSNGIRLQAPSNCAKHRLIKLTSIAQRLVLRRSEGILWPLSRGSSTSRRNQFGGAGLIFVIFLHDKGITILKPGLRIPALGDNCTTFELFLKVNGFVGP